MNFSKHLSIVYTLIVAIPLMLFILGASEYLRTSLTNSLEKEAVKVVADNTAYIENGINQIDRLESILTSDYELLRTFYYADEADQDSLVETLRRDIKNIERLQFALPQIYSLHIFVQNPYMPERWPILFHEQRLDFSRFGRWTYNYRDEVMGNIESSKESAACLTSEFFLNKRHVGFIQISMKMASIFPFLYQKEDPYYKNYVFIKDENIIQETEMSSIIRYEVLNDNPDNASGSFTIRTGNENIIVAYSRIPRLDLLLVHTSSPSVINKSIFLIRLASFFLLLASIALMFILINFTTKKLVTRLYVVMNGMRKIREGNLDVSISVTGSDEVAEMAVTFTAMVDRIQRLISEIKKEQVLVTQTEIKAMQNQINAHFLYNVLETVKMQAELHDQAEIVESLTLLGRMMRYCLKWRNHRVLLSQEIEYIHDYIALMNIRNDYSISLSVNIDEKYLAYEIPKMLIQPIIENAVLHAIEPLGENADLEITAVPDPASGWLCIQITDFGVGMDSGQIDTLGKQLEVKTESDSPVGGIGLQNIQQRLHAFYGPEYSLRIQSSPGAGTIIFIPVPLEKS